MHLGGMRSVLGLFPPKWGCFNFFWAGVGGGLVLGLAGVIELSPSEQSDSEEASTTNAVSLLLLEGTAGVEISMDSSILFSFLERRESSCFFSSVVLRFFVGVFFAENNGIGIKMLAYNYFEHQNIYCYL